MSIENISGEGEDPSAALSSLLAFWSDAGVDAAYADAPLDRLAERRPRPPAVVIDAAPPPSPAAADPGRGAGGARVQAAHDAASAAADLTELQTAAQAFFASPNGPVPIGRGATGAEVLVVGDAPTAEDEAEGRAFAGSAGRLLDRLLAAAGLGERAWLTYATLQRPGPGANAEADGSAVSAPFLLRTAALLRPRAVLLLGDGPVRLLLQQSAGVMSLRGRWFEWAGAPALATFPPGFLLRQPLAKKRAWEDVLTLALRLDHTPPAP